MTPVFITPRDYDLFRSLERCPLTVRQLRILSGTFPLPFRSDRRLQHRLVQLTRAGLLHRSRYATADGWGEYYYLLSRESYRLLHGRDERPPSAGMFKPIGISRHHHTQRLADFLVHTLVAAHYIGAEVRDLVRENTLKLVAQGESLFPDAAFTIALPGRAPFVYYVEVDNSTEPLTTMSPRDSWSRKLRFYESLQDGSDTRFRVLGVITRSEQRLHNLSALAATLTANPQRALFYGVYLPSYLDAGHPLTTPLFQDHRGLHVSLLPIDRRPFDVERPREMAMDILHPTKEECVAVGI